MLLQPITSLVILTGGLILGFGAHFGFCLHCMQCAYSNSTMQLRCTHPELYRKSSRSVSQRCFPGEVCAKHVIFFTNVTDGTRFVDERVERKCSEYHPEKGDVLDGCVLIHNVNPPFSGLRCLCNETNFCNAGSPVFKSNLPLHLFVFVLVILALNKDVMLHV